MVELMLFWILAGCALGVFTGLVPGIHVNTLAVMVLAFAATGDFNLVLLIVSMSVVHSFVDFVPSILFGAVESDSFLAILPGHKYLLDGNGYYAIKLTVLGGLFGGIVSISVVPLYFLFIGQAMDFLLELVPFLLLLVLALMVVSENGWGKLFGLVVILLSAVLGVLVLRGNFLLSNSIFPLVTGFFGVPTLLYSLNRNQELVKQKIRKCKFNPAHIAKGTLLAVFGGAMVSLLPSLGPSQAAFILRKLVGRIKRSVYLVILGGINTSNMIFSFFVLYAIGKTRTGSAVAIKEMIYLQQEHLFFIIAAVLIAIGFGVFATDLVAKIILKRIQFINYRKINILVLGVISLLVFAFSGVFGFLIMCIATSVGMLALVFGVKRTCCMAFLMAPTILFYFGI